MQLSDLAALQKRVQDARKFTDDGVLRPDLRAKLGRSIAALAAAISSSWESGAVDEARIVDLERELEELCEAARLEARTYTPIKKEETFSRTAE